MEEYDGTRYIKIPIKEWGYKQLVTLDLLKNYVNNEDYLLGETEELWDSTPPVTRKLFKPLAMDENRSFGVVLTSNNEYVFYDKDNTTVLINFTDAPGTTSYRTKMIDTVKTTAVYDNNTITIPKKQVNTLDKNTRDYSPFTAYDSSGNPLSNDMTCNEFWYIGYDKSRAYETRPNWVMNEEHGGIPSICRAQTFKVDLEDKSLPYGVLESVVLNLHGENLQYGVPLIVEITEAVKYDDAYYPASRDHINNSRYNTTEYGDGKVAKQIAKQYYIPSNTDPGVVAITFDWGARVEDGKYYAIVLRSPLNHQPNPYSVGGWNKHCDPEIYKDGDAFLSSNNGYNWLRYGKDENVSYHEGMYAPQDFAFQAHIRQEYTTYETGSFEIYTKPIHCPGIERIGLSANDEQQDGKITYYAYNNTTGEWVEFDTYGYVNFETEESRPDVTIIKAVLTLAKQGRAPYIKAMGIDLHHAFFKTAMLRTLAYTPRTDGILAANTYSHVHCPYTVHDIQKDTVTVDVVLEKEATRHMSFIPLTKIPEYSTQCDSVTEAVKKEIQAIIDTKREDDKQELIRVFLLTHTSLFLDLRSINVYVLEDPNLGSVILNDDVSYPIISCSLQPLNASTIEFTEYLDYTINYDEETTKEEGNILSFNKVATNKLVEGTLTVKYNPVFYKNLPTTDYANYSSKDVDLSFLKETVLVKEEDLTQRVLSIYTHATALNPIRSITCNDIVFVENEDYTVDYDNKTIQLNTDKLTAGANVVVKYTPYLVEDSISLVYHLNRELIGDYTNISLDGNYIDYKT